MAPPTEPKSDRSKDFSSFSTIETFVGRSIVLSNDEVEEYRELMDSIQQEFHPATFGEKWLAQGIVDGEWRLRRNLSVEKGFHLLGEREFGREFAYETDPGARAVLIKNRLLQARGKQLKQITQHTKWLRKQLEKDIAELLAMQNERHRPTRHGIHAVPKRRIT
jgi:hypothetical protein